MNDLKAKRGAGYVRVSSDTQIDNTSISDQVEKIELYCKLHNIELVQIFKDEAESGSTIDTKKRKGYADMIEFISSEENAINAVIVNKIDRIHRSGKNLLVMVEDVLEPINVAFISITEQFDTSTAQGKLFLTMLGGFAEFERKTINARTKGGRVKTARNGAYAGGSIAFGYTLVSEEPFVINVVDIEASIVKDIFKMRAEGYSLGRIASELNARNVKNAKGNEWSKQGVDYILKNRTYLGEYTYNGKKEQNEITYKVPRIVSKQLWNKVHG